MNREKVLEDAAMIAEMAHDLEQLMIEAKNQHENGLRTKSRVTLGKASGLSRSIYLYLAE